MTLRLPPKPSQREIGLAVNQILEGKLNCTGSVTLADDTTTTVSDTRVSGESYIQLSPTNAAASIATVYVSAQTSGEFVLSHSAGTGRDFNYVIIG